MPPKDPKHIEDIDDAAQDSAPESIEKGPWRCIECNIIHRKSKITNCKECCGRRDELLIEELPWTCHKCFQHNEIREDDTNDTCRHCRAAEKHKKCDRCYWSSPQEVELGGLENIPYKDEIMLIECHATKLARFVARDLDEVVIEALMEELLVIVKTKIAEMDKAKEAIPVPGTSTTGLDKGGSSAVPKPQSKGKKKP